MRITKKLSKSLLIFGSLGLLGLSSSNLVSCSFGEKPATWADFKDKASHENVISIIKKTNILQWSNVKISDLKTSKFECDSINQTVSISVVDQLPYSSASFVARFDQQNYNLNDWVYNSDFDYKFIKNTNSVIKDFTVTSFNNVDNKIFLTTANHGLYQSDDFGKTYSQNKSIPNAVKIKQFSLIVDHSSPTLHHLYAATNKGLYSAIDGHSFKLVNEFAVNKITIINNVTYLATNAGLWTISNSGTVSQVSGVPSDLNINQIGSLSTKQDDIFLVTNKGFYRSDDFKNFSIDKILNAKIELKQVVEVSLFLYAIAVDGTTYKALNNKALKLIKNNVKLYPFQKINQFKLKKIISTANYDKAYAINNDGGLYFWDGIQEFSKYSNFSENKISDLFVTDGTVYLMIDHKFFITSVDQYFTMTILYQNFNIPSTATINQIITYRKITHIVTSAGLYNNNNTATY